MYSTGSALGKWRLASGILRSGRMRLKHISRSHLANDSGWSSPTSLPFMYHSSMPQKWAWRRLRSNALTNWATSGSCSVGPIGPQMPTGSSGVA